MVDTDSDSSEDEFKVNTELSELEKDYENLLRDSQTLVTWYYKLKKKNEELVLQFSEKNKIIEKQSNKVFKLSKEIIQLSALLKAESDSSPPSDRGLSDCCQPFDRNLSKLDSSQPYDEVIAL